MLVDGSGMHKGADAAAPIRKRILKYWLCAFVSSGFTYFLLVPEETRERLEEKTMNSSVSSTTATAAESRVFPEDSWLGFAGDVSYFIAAGTAIITIGVPLVVVDKTAEAVGLDFWNSKKK